MFNSVLCHVLVIFRRKGYSKLFLCVKPPSGIERIPSANAQWWPTENSIKTFYAPPRRGADFILFVFGVNVVVNIFIKNITDPSPLSAMFI